MKMHGIMLFSLAIAGLTALPLLAKAQSLVDASASSSPAALPTNAALPDLTYTRPTQKMKIRNYAFDEMCIRDRTKTTNATTSSKWIRPPAM